MKIAFFVQHMIIGGVEKNLLRLCDALVKYFYICNKSIW